MADHGDCPLTVKSIVRHHKDDNNSNDDDDDNNHNIDNSNYSNNMKFKFLSFGAW